MSNFPQGQGGQGIARSRAQLYVAQAIPKIDAEIAGKGHLCLEAIGFAKHTVVYRHVDNNLIRLVYQSWILLQMILKIHQLFLR